MVKGIDTMKWEDQQKIKKMAGFTDQVDGKRSLPAFSNKDRW